MLEPLFDGPRAPRIIGTDCLLARPLHLLGEDQEALGGIGAAVEDHVLDMLQELWGDVRIDRKLARVDNAHVHPRLNGMVEKRRVHRFAHHIVAAERERHVADAAADVGAGQVLAYPFRRAEKIKDNEWEVKTISIMNTTGMTDEELQKQHLQAQPQEYRDEINNHIIWEVKTHRLRDPQSNEDIARFSGVRALTILAQLEADTIGDNPVFQRANPELVAQYADILDNDIFEREYNEIEHFLKVAEWNDLVFTVEGLPKEKKQGRLMQDGRYRQSDIERSHKTRESALMKPPGKEEDKSILGQAFEAVRVKKDLDTFLKATEVISQTDKAMNSVADLERTCLTFLEGQYEYSNHLRRTLEAFNSTKENLEQAQEAGALIKLVRRNVVEIEIAFLTYIGQSQMAMYKDGPESNALEPINALTSKIESIVEEEELSPELVTTCKSAMMEGKRNRENIVRAVKNGFSTTLQNYEAARKRWQEKFDKDPDAVASDANVVAAKKPLKLGE